MLAKDLLDDAHELAISEVVSLTGKWCVGVGMTSLSSRRFRSAFVNTLLYSTSLDSSKRVHMASAVLCRS